MADIICRWRNGTPKTVVELVNSLPHSVISIDNFRNFMQSSIWGPDFFRTPYQLACQLGLYCEAEDGYYYPRFDHDINEVEAKDYLEFWITRYYVPNPYVNRDGFNNIDCPTYVLYELYKYTKDNPNCSYKEAYKHIFKEEAANNNDIVKNYINNYSKILEFSPNGLLSITSINPNMTFDFMRRTDKKGFFDTFDKKKNIQITSTVDSLNKSHIQFLTALRTKPFMLLAGISGTGKSRIVREMAKACWKPEDDEYWKDKEKQIRNNHPRNFCMVQVKPNWHDSSELIGYVTRISGTPEFVPGPFLTFMAKAIKEPEVPYFLCLDEMNLAPVEQYFAEYLSVIESRKVNKDPVSGQTIIDTDPIIKPSDSQEYHDLIGKLLGDEERMKGTTLTIPQNLFVVGTVNMDETTFSFSRKVLDRAMTIEMNEVDLHGGLEKDSDNEIGYIGNSIIGDAAEGSDVYAENKELCDEVLAYLEQVNTILEGSPFKIAYRTRNEFLMYAVNRKILAPDSQLWQTLDEMTSMKILSRIEGDSDRTQKVLERLKVLVEEEIVAKMNNITGLAPSHPVDTGEAHVLPSKTGEVPVHPSDTGETPVFPGEATIFPSKTGEAPVLRSISAAKIEEMLGKLGTGFTSYWA